MSNGAIPVDGPRSLAWRENGQVHLVLHLGYADLAVGEGVMRFRQQDNAFRRAALLEPCEGGTTLRVRVPVRRFNRDAWSMALHPVRAGSFRPLETRILARAGQPVALLQGPKPTTRLAPPEPRRQVVRQQVRRARHVLGRARRAAAARLGR